MDWSQLPGGKAGERQIGEERKKQTNWLPKDEG